MTKVGKKERRRYIKKHVIYPSQLGVSPGDREEFKELQMRVNFSTGLFFMTLAYTFIRGRKSPSFKESFSGIGLNLVAFFFSIRAAKTRDEFVDVLDSRYFSNYSTSKIKSLI